MEGANDVQGDSMQQVDLHLDHEPEVPNEAAENDDEEEMKKAKSVEEVADDGARSVEADVEEGGADEDDNEDFAAFRRRKRQVVPRHPDDIVDRINRMNVIEVAVHAENVEEKELERADGFNELTPENIFFVGVGDRPLVWKTYIRCDFIHLLC